MSTNTQNQTVVDDNSIKVCGLDFENKGACRRLARVRVAFGLGVVCWCCREHALTMVSNNPNRQMLD